MSPINDTSKIRPESKKSNSSNKVLKYVGLIVVSLALVGLIFTSFYSGSETGPNSMVFGRYGNRNIVYSQENSFGQAVESALANYNANADLGDEFFSFMRYMAWQDAFSSVVFNTAIAYNLDSSGYIPSPRAVDRQIVLSGPYRTNGEFDESKYQAASQASKDNIREFMREELTLTTWGQDVLNSQYHSGAQLDFLWKMRADQRSYEYISIPFTDFPEGNVVEYAKTNSKLFSRIPVSRITVSDEKAANEIITSYTGRKQELSAFADLAAEQSKDAYAEDGGSMGATDYYRLSELIGNENTDSIFAANEGDVVGPFSTEYGWMIVKIDGKAVESNPADRIDDVRSYMLQNEVGLIEDNLIARAEELRLKALADGSFNTAMVNEGFEVLETSLFPVNFGADSLVGGNPENSGNEVLSGSSSSDDFWNNIVPLDQVGSISKPVVLNGSIALFALAAKDAGTEELSYWDALVDYEVSRSRQTEFRTAILNPESDLLKNKFRTAYDGIFGSES